MTSTSQIFVVVYRPGPAFRNDAPLLKQNLGAHGDYIQNLVNAGVVLAAGPTFDIEGGMVLMTARSLKEAQRRLAADPAIINGVFRGEVTNWQPFFDPDQRFAPAKLKRD